MKSYNSIVITGANGFLGSWLTHYFSSNGYIVHGFIRKTSDDFRLNGVNSQILRLHESEYAEKIKEIQPSIVILADWSGVSSSSRNSEEQLENISRWESLATACVEAGVGKLVAFGSQAELGTQQVGATEEFAENPASFYAEAKCRAHKILRYATFGTQTEFCWVRLFSIYGPGDNPNWLIPTIIRKIRLNEELDLTECTHSWNYLHVFDLARLTHCLISSNKQILLLHAAHPKSTSLKDYILTLADQLGDASLLNFGAVPYTSQMVSGLSPKVGLALSLGWKPVVDWDFGVTNLLTDSESLSIQLESFMKFFGKIEN